MLVGTPMTTLMLSDLSEPEPVDVARAYDSVAEVYDGVYLGPKDIAENRHVIQSLARDEHLVGQVVDAGCGTGFLLDQTGLDWRRYTGIDISRGMVQRAFEKHPKHRFFVQDMQDMRDLPSESCDSVVSLFESFNYCLQPEVALTEMWRLIRPGGRVFIMSGGPRLARRGVHVLDAIGRDVTRVLHTPGKLRRLMQDRFMDVQVRGMSCLIDYLPRSLPQRYHDRWLNLEAATVGRLLPSACFYHIATGRKAGFQPWLSPRMTYAT